MHMNVVFRDYARQYSHIFRVADLHEQIPAPYLDVAHEHVMAVLCDPDDMRRQPRDGVPAVPVVSHGRDFYHATQVCSN